MGRDPQRDQDPDDWFAEPDTSAVTRRGGAVAPGDASPSAPDAASEDWLSEPDPGSRLRTGPLPARTKIAVAAVGLVAALVVGLLVGGVFDPAGSPQSTPTTSPATTTRPETSTSTATTPAASRIPVPTTPLAPGDEGSAVAALQRALARAGGAVDTVDGQYGPATKDAVAQFQTSVRLTADGIAGTQTLAALNRKLNGP
jgi:hypothetical protein